MLSGSFLLLCAAGVPTQESASPAIDLDVALAAFEEARQLAAADAGALWGIPLDFPLLFIDPVTRVCVANRAGGSAGQLLKPEGPEGRVWTGQYPDELIIANATTQWAGRRWTMLAWPLPSDRLGRARLLMHESFHNAQYPLKIDGGGAGFCNHLATHDGRVWLRLEAQALAAAIRSEADQREEAAGDALLFRALRRALFPGVDAAEDGLERLEGSAEYTGVRLASDDPGEQVKATVKLLEGLASRPSLTRSFSYATGPALGLLLDEYDPFWREMFLRGETFTNMLAPAVWFEPPPNVQELEAKARERAQHYGFEKIAAEEAAREKLRQSRLATYRQRYIDGPVLILPALAPQSGFDPSRIEPLEGVGDVYGTLWLSDDWGVADAPGGGLILRNQTVHLALPRDVEGPELSGDGWTLELKPGWEVVPGKRDGDHRLVMVGEGEGAPG